MRKIEIVDYRDSWRGEFVDWGRRIRRVAREQVLRIDHIGSTAVLDLGAKDVIDIQLTVADLDDLTGVERLAADGFVHRPEVAVDYLVGSQEDDHTNASDFKKRYLREPPGARRVHVHVREDGRLNQRYALLFRDYLRGHRAARTGYETVKRRLARLFPYDIDGYLSIKDPYMDAVYEAAELWAKLTDWRPADDFL